MLSALIPVCFPVLATLATATPTGGEAKRTLDIYWIDAEGGASTLVVSPTGQSLLVDSANRKPDDRDAKRIHAVAKQAGLSKIDILLTTHYHGDHMGAMEALSKLIPIELYVDHGDSVEVDRPKAAEAYKAYVAHTAGKRKSLAPGDKIPLDGVDAVIVAGGAKVIDKPLKGGGPNKQLCKTAAQKDPDFDPENNHSLGFVLRYGKFDFLNLGDLHWNFELPLVCPINRLGKVDVYQTTHHGLDRSGSPQVVWAHPAARGGDEQRSEEGWAPQHLRDPAQIARPGGHLARAPGAGHPQGAEHRRVDDRQPGAYRHLPGSLAEAVGRSRRQVHADQRPQRIQQDLRLALKFRRRRRAIGYSCHAGRGMADVQAFEEGQRAILEAIATGRPLPDVLEQIVLLIERQADGLFCSILLLDRERGTVHHGAAPNLPRELVTGIDGQAIGPQAGSCGAAAYLGEPVVVEDIGTHPNWRDYRQLVLPAGLRACWSSPIFAPASREVMGTFAVYYREARCPKPEERSWVDRATHLAAIAIARDRAERAARRADARYRQIVDTAYEGVWLIDADARTLLVNERTAKLLGLEADDLVGRRITEFMDESSRLVAEGSFIQRVRTVSDQHQFRFRHRDGSYFWALISGSPIRDEKGQASGALCMITDISELKVTEQALRQSEAEFRVVFENAGIGMGLAGRDGKLVRTNPALQRFLGYSETELAGHHFWDFTHPDDVPADRDLYDRLTSGTAESYQNERRYLRRDGSVVWGRLTATVVRPDKGKPLLAIGMIENVTERRRMEEAVRSSERLRALIYDSVTDVLFYLGVEPPGHYRFLSVNPAFLKATGLTEDQVVNKLIEEVIPDPARALVLGHYARAIRERRTISWDEVSRYPAGVKYGEVSITPVFDADGKCTNLVGTVHDVTERRLAEERLSAQAAMLDRAKDAIILRDVDGVVQSWNKGAERLYGWSSAEAVGRNVLELIYRDPGVFREARAQLLERGEWSGELPQVTRAGKPLIVEGSWTLIPEQPGQPRTVVAIHTDVTEKRRLEAQVLRAQRLDSLGTQAGGIAHDFNNLLMVIGEGLSLALADLGPDHPARDSLKGVEKAVLHGASLTRQMLTFSGQHESIRKLVRLDRVVTDALGLLRASLPRTVALQTDFDTQAPEILADPTQIQQIVMNLGSNAAHAMSASGRGTLDVRVQSAVLDAPLTTESSVLTPGIYARLVVADTGVGMDELTREHIFDPLFTTKPAGEGTGLGLSVVHGIVKSHHGGIIVRSAPGQGSEFTVYFPAAPRARAVSHARGTPSPAENPPAG